MFYPLKQITLAVLLACSGSAAISANYYFVQPKAPEMSKAAPISAALSAYVLPLGTVGTAYNSGLGFNLNTLLTVAGDPSYSANAVSWSVQSGAIPEGLTFSSGAINGTPTAPGSQSFSVRASYREVNAEQAYQLVTQAAANGTLLTVTPAVNGKTSWDLAVDGPLVLSVPGAYTIVPTLGTPVTLKAWGAAGGNGMPDSVSCPFVGSGGAGAYAAGAITLKASKSYVVWVGSGGTHGVSVGAPFGGGGQATLAANGYISGSGGGLTGFFTTSAIQVNAELIAAGGGGGSGYARGGAGDQDGYWSTYNSRPGKKGTLISGGLAGAIGSHDSLPQKGAALQGGGYLSSGYSGGGGGSGYFGGGAGGSNNYAGDSGGGGASYTSASLQSPVISPGVSNLPGNNGDATRGSAGAPAPAYTAGASPSMCSGGPGKLIIGK